MPVASSPPFSKAERPADDLVLEALEAGEGGGPDRVLRQEQARGVLGDLEHVLAAEVDEVADAAASPVDVALASRLHLAENLLVRQPAHGKAIAHG